MIKHRPLFGTKMLEERYSKKDGVPVSYVCTTALDLCGTKAVDVFFRETPHPEFGNRYFGIFLQDDKPMITNADKVESLIFEMIEVNGEWHYSTHRWDFYTVGDVSIDGGRAYLRLVGNFADKKRKSFKVKDGTFVEISE